MKLQGFCFILFQEKKNQTLQRNPAFMLKYTDVPGHIFALWYQKRVQYSPRSQASTFSVEDLDTFSMTMSF